MVHQLGSSPPYNLDADGWLHTTLFHHLSSDEFLHIFIERANLLQLGCRPTLELGYKNTPRMQSSVGTRMQLYTSDAVRHWGSDTRGYRRMGNTSNPRCGVKKYKALIKADNLKGLLGCPTCETLRIHPDYPQD